MKRTNDETKAKIYPADSGALWDDAAAWMERDENNPHITGLVAIPEVDPMTGRARIGIFNAQRVRVGFLAAFAALALLSGCARYCSGRPHYHQAAADTAPVFCTTDTDCSEKFGGEY